MIRSRLENIGGPFPGVGAAPEMTRDFVLPRDRRAAFEKLNDAAARRPTMVDFGSLAPANDNRPGNKQIKKASK
ncbi:hypothetical protein [Rhizobium miluonense]|uniref:Uncharacterized protein n=1 Tax=Rhizobium miluonense TaxID=411945 RepID=A0A1C3WPD7_9HYPH|nr:hypothetical protein [Rhizobium miluonense]SCB41839.1 hypothetical protein GA0061102_103530 [Rhizobium miluonense]